MHGNDFDLSLLQHGLHGFVQAREDYGVNIILAPTFATDWLATRMEEEVTAHELVSGKEANRHERAIEYTEENETCEGKF